jgi:hypothetical protein
MKPNNSKILAKRRPSSATALRAQNSLSALLSEMTDCRRLCECKTQPLASMTPQETLLRCESGATQFISLQSRRVTIRLPWSFLNRGSLTPRFGCHLRHLATRTSRLISMSWGADRRPERRQMSHQNAGPVVAM